MGMITGEAMRHEIAPVHETPCDWHDYGQSHATRVAIQRGAQSPKRAPPMGGSTISPASQQLVKLAIANLSH